MTSKRIKYIKVLKASITVEAALILPIFLFFFLAFLSFLQVFIVQEHIQSAITKEGLSLAKGAYVYDDFVGLGDVLEFDTEFFDTEMDQELKNLAKSTVDGTIVKQMIQKHLDIERINNSCIKEGFTGISFYGTTVLNHENDIDIIVRYRTNIPFDIFGIGDMRFIQRVRLRGWTGHKVPARYRVGEEGDTDETIVYITETGSVYHLSSSCSHISFSIEEVQGIPSNRRNNSGGKYYPCKSCCKQSPEEHGTFFITAYGTRYHTIENCSRIKRTVQEVPLSKVKNRALCKRCSKNNN